MYIICILPALLSLLFAPHATSSPLNIVELKANESLGTNDTLGTPDQGSFEDIIATGVDSLRRRGIPEDYRLKAIVAMTPNPNLDTANRPQDFKTFTLTYQDDSTLNHYVGSSYTVGGTWSRLVLIPEAPASSQNLVLQGLRLTFSQAFTRLAAEGEAGPWNYAMLMFTIKDLETDLPSTEPIYIFNANYPVGRMVTVGAMTGRVFDATDIPEEVEYKRLSLLNATSVA